MKFHSYPNQAITFWYVYLLCWDLFHFFDIAFVSRQNISFTPRSFKLHYHFAVFNHCTHVVNLSQDLGDHVQLWVLENPARQAKGQLIANFDAVDAAGNKAELFSNMQQQLLKHSNEINITWWKLESFVSSETCFAICMPSAFFANVLSRTFCFVDVEI